MTIGPYKNCQAEGCSAKHYAKSFCRTHYLRFKATGNPFGMKKVGGHNKGSSPPCRVQGCDKVSRGLRLCGLHYQRLRRQGSELFWILNKENSTND